MPDYTFENTVAVDVDQTLIVDGRVNQELVDWIKTNHDNETFRFICWSQRGQRHAKKVCEELGIEEYFIDIISKPSIMIDDDFSWLDDVKKYKPRNLE